VNLENTGFLAAEYGGMTIMCQDNIRGCRSPGFRAEAVEVNVLYKILEILLAKHYEIIYK